MTKTPHTSPPLPLILILWGKLDGFWAKIETVFLVSFLGVMIVLTFSQVVLRNFFNSGVFWFDPVVRHLVLWVGFMGASLATHKRHHINIDALSKFFKGNYRHGVNILAEIFAMFICIVLLWASYNFVKDTFLAGERINEVFPAWLAQLVLPYSFFSMSLRFGFDALRQIWRFTKGLEPESFSAHAVVEDGK